MLICCPIHLVMENCFCKRNRDRPKRHGPDCLRHIGQIFPTGGGEGKLPHDGGVLRAGDGGKNVGKSSQEPVTQKSKRHRFFGVAAQPQILLGAHVDAMGAKPFYLFVAVLYFLSIEVFLLTQRKPQKKAV